MRTKNVTLWYNFLSHFTTTLLQLYYNFTTTLLQLYYNFVTLLI